MLDLGGGALVLAGGPRGRKARIQSQIQVRGKKEAEEGYLKEGRVGEGAP
jgi:hypothetical protein